MSTSAPEDLGTAGVGTAQPILSGRGLSKHFGGVRAVSDVDIDLRQGEVTALVGDNGAGKSTLTKMLSGIYSADGGTLRVRGTEIALSGPDSASQAGIQTVYQDLALCDNLNTIQNLFLGREITGPRWTGHRLAWSEMEHRASRVLGDLGVKIRSLFTPVGQLSGGQRQGIAICRSVLTEPDIILLDEPTAALGVAQKEQVLNLLDRLRRQGRAVMVISHDLHDVQQIADRVVVLRLGRKVAEFSKGSFRASDIVDAITGASSGGAK
jgi:D-xylose transport system ATP-binding protein